MERLNLKSINSLRKYWPLIAAGVLIPLTVAALNYFPYVVTPKIDAGNIRTTGNTVSTLNTNGDLTLSPNGTGKLIYSPGTASTVPYLDASKKLTSSAVTPTELGYLSGVTSALQTQIDLKAPLANPTFSGTVTGTFSGSLTGNVTGNVTGSSGSTTGNAATATALAADPADCASNTYATAINASGTLSCGTVTNAGLAGSIAASKLVGTDIATVGTITSGTWSGTTIAIADGGTGQTAKQAAFDALSPLTTAGDMLTYSSGHNDRIGTVIGDVHKTWHSGGASVPNAWSLVDVTTDITGITPVENGGTGIGTLSAHDVIIGNGTSAPNYVAPGTSGNVLTSNGTDWTSAAGGAGGGTPGLLDGTNGNFENGTTAWTASGGTFTTASSTNILDGSGSVTWDSNGAAQTLDSTAVTIPYGLYGRNGGARCKIMTPSGAATHTIQAYDGSAAVGPINTVISSTVPTYSDVHFIFPSTGTLQIRLTSVASNEPLIAIDSCNIYDASQIDIGSVSQATFIGSAYFATTGSCTWTVANAAYTDFGTTSACPGPTIESNPGPGTIQTTDADLPQITINNMPPGNYLIMVETQLANSGSATGTARISDGTTNTGYCAEIQGSGIQQTCNMHGVFSYTNTANHTFKIQGAISAGGTLSLQNAANLNTTHFYIYRYPTVSDSVYKPDVMPSSWSGYHDSDCSWSLTSNGSVADPTGDSTCTFTEKTNRNYGTVASATSSGNNIPGIVWTPKRAGFYFICANATASMSSGAGRLSLTDGTTVIATAGMGVASNATTVPLCGIYNASSVASKTIKIQGGNTSAVTMTLGGASGAPAVHSVDWTIFAIDQSFPTPLLVNSMVAGRSGVTKTGRVQIASGCASATTDPDGMYASGTSNSTGNCTTTLATGYFSAAPLCTCNALSTAAALLKCDIDTTTTITSTTVRTYTAKTSDGTATAAAFVLDCRGAP